jgi:hypothetical protein
MRSNESAANIKPRHVISASRKTDIPAFYTEWFMNRIRAGFCHWINPYTGQVYNLSLKPEDCVAIVFWTRNPIPLLPYLDELTARGFKYYFHFTIMGYPPAIETHAPALNQAIRAFQALSEHVTPDRVFWKYDPILISHLTPPQYHIDRFGEIAGRLSGYTRRCAYSWLIMFEQTQQNLAGLQSENGITIHNLSRHSQHKMLAEMVKIAQANDLQLHSCFSDDYLHIPGIQAGSCVDIQVLRKLTAKPDLEEISAAQFGQALRGKQNDRTPIDTIRALAARGRRALKFSPSHGPCRCVASIDIGSDDTCLFGCTYCLATHSRRQALQNYQARDPTDSLLSRPEHLRAVDLNERGLPDLHPLD